MPVAGGGGEAAMTVVRARVTAGNPPTAVQMLGFDIHGLGQARRGGRPERGSRQGRLGQDGAGSRCRNSPSTTASGSPHRSTSTPPTGFGPTRKSSPKPASPASRRTGTNSSPQPKKCRRPATSPSRTAASPGRTRRYSTAWCCPPAESTITARPLSSSIRRRSTRPPPRRSSSACRRSANWSTRISPVVTGTWRQAW